MIAEQLESLVENAPEDSMYYTSGIHLPLLLSMCMNFRPDAIHGSREMLEALRAEIVITSNQWTERPESFYGVPLRLPGLTRKNKSIKFPKNILAVVTAYPSPGQICVYTDTSRSPEGYLVDPPSDEEISQAVTNLGAIK